MLQLRGLQSSFRPLHVQIAGLNLQVNGDALGCPEFPSEVDGYFIHSDEPLGLPTKLYSRRPWQKTASTRQDGLRKHTDLQLNCIICIRLCNSTPQSRRCGPVF